MTKKGYDPLLNAKCDMCKSKTTKVFTIQRVLHFSCDTHEFEVAISQEEGKVEKLRTSNIFRFRRHEPTKTK